MTGSDDPRKDKWITVTLGNKEIGRDDYVPRYAHDAFGSKYLVEYVDLLKGIMFVSPAFNAFEMPESRLYLLLVDGEIKNRQDGCNLLQEFYYNNVIGPMRYNDFKNCLDNIDEKIELIRKKLHGDNND